LDNIEYYQPTGPSYTYVYPQVFQIGDDPIFTTNTSSTVTTTVASTGNLSVGDVITIVGAEDTGGITAAQLNITTAITAIDPGVSFSYVSTGTASGTVDGGGGANVSYYFAALPYQFQINDTLSNADSSVIYSDNSAATAFQALVTSSSGQGSLIVNILQTGIK
jgi:hypothetical protein